MNNSDGTWAVKSPEKNNPKLISFEPDGEALAVRCQRGNGLPDFLGVGFVHDNALCVARGLVQQKAELGQKVGLVKYDIRALGELPARWYHCSLNGRISDGLSSAGPSETLIGEYRADYSAGDGTAFNPLRKTIAKRDDEYQFSWWDDEKFHYLGIGCIVANNLFAAWGPPGALVQFVSYDIGTSGQTLCGNWYDLGRGLSGTETLERV